MDVEIFFETPNAVDPPAARICGRCEVSNECLIFALLTENPQETRYGWMGNKAPIERTKIYKVMKGILS